MGDDDTFPTLTDNSASGNDGTMTNMESGDIVDDPAGHFAVLIPPPAGFAPIPGALAGVDSIDQIIAFTCAVAKGIRPVVDNLSPAAGASIGQLDPITFDVTDDSGEFTRILVVAFYAQTGIEEVVHDGEIFRGLYANTNSSRAVIANGFKYTIVRTGGLFPGNVTFRAFAIDKEGLENL